MKKTNCVLCYVSFGLIVLSVILSELLTVYLRRGHAMPIGYLGPHIRIVIEMMILSAIPVVLGLIAAKKKNKALKIITLIFCICAIVFQFVYGIVLFKIAISGAGFTRVQSILKNVLGLSASNAMTQLVYYVGMGTRHFSSAFWIAFLIKMSAGLCAILKNVFMIVTVCKIRRVDA